MKIQPIKSELKDLSSKQLLKKKTQIGDFLMNRPKGDRVGQGYATMDTLYDLIEAMNSEDEFTGEVIKELCFQ